MNKCLVAAVVAFAVAWVPFWLAITTAVIFLVAGCALSASDNYQKRITRDLGFWKRNNGIPGSPLGALLLALIFSSSVIAQQSFSELTGQLTVKPVQDKSQWEVPYLTWGGDCPFFDANGGLETKNGSTYQQMGLNLKFVNGDDFVGQAKRYVQGETPFIRGTDKQFGQGSEVLGSNPAIKPVWFLQLTYSAGDHVVATANIKTLNDLKRPGKKLKWAMQQGGPHVGWVYEILQTASFTKDDVELVFTKDLSGDNGPGALFKKGTADLACVITPDMIGLTGGVDQKGSGSEGTVKDAHVLVSTQQMSRAIIDLLGCRSDWYAQNKSVIEKIVAGYLKSCVRLVGLRGDFEKTKKLSGDYKAVLTQAQTIFGKAVCPTLEVDTHGLLLDATFVGLPGQIAFFEDQGNLSGFEPKMKAALDFAVAWGYAKTRCGFAPAGLDYNRIATLAGVTYEAPKLAARVKAEALDVFPDSNLDEKTLYSFTVYFGMNEDDFPIDQYGADLAKTISLYGKSAWVIIGHSDTTRTLVDFLKAGMEKGEIKRSGSPGQYSYFLNGQPLDVKNTREIARLIEAGSFTGASINPRDTMGAAMALSISRANRVKEKIEKYTKDQGINLDLSQIKPMGKGIMEPVIPKPKNEQEAMKNMRVEFRLIKVAAEAIQSSDFDY